MPQGGHQGRQDLPAPQGRLEGGTGKTPPKSMGLGWRGEAGKSRRVREAMATHGAEGGYEAAPSAPYVLPSSVPRYRKCTWNKLEGGQGWDPPFVCSDLK